MQTDNRSKFLSLLLRHKPEVKNLRLDKNGWCEIEDLLIKTDFTLEELKKIVSEDEKQRYSFKDDYSFIRANQGHSIAVDLKLKKVVPPVLLYHGTTKENLESILKSGLSKMNRNYVHLSNNLETATSVAMRRKKEIVILTIDSKKMFEEDCSFYLSENNVYLIDSVPAKFISKL